MSLETLRPSTLDGIKRLAKSIKKSRALKYATALNESARQAGFENYQHANRSFQSAEPARPKFNLFLTAYWGSRSARQRETLKLQLSMPLDDLINSKHRRRHSVLAQFRLGEADHLVWKETEDKQSSARWWLCKAARILQFINATGLLPVTSSRNTPQTDRLPHRDHVSVWVDRDDGSHVVTDEPYQAAIKYHDAERGAWVQAQGLRLVRSSWPGMHNPSSETGTQLFLVAENSDSKLLDALLEKLNNADAPVLESLWGQTGQRWSAESAAGLPKFRSPLAKNRPLKKRTAIVHSGASRPHQSVNYAMVMARGRRPAATMPIAAHKEIGHALKSVLSMSGHRAGVTTRLNSVRSELDNWVQQEYDAATLTNEEFFDLYYHDHDSRHVRTPTKDERDTGIRRLERAKQLLEQHYPSCAPLRQLTHRMQGALNSLATWGAKAA